MNLGIVLSKLRIERHLSQRDLSIQLGVSSGAIGMWETNKRFPDLNMLVKIANYFNVTTDYLLGLTSIRSNNDINVIGNKISLSEDELKLVNTYRKLTSDGKQIVIGKAIDLKLTETIANRKKDIG